MPIVLDRQPTIGAAASKPAPTRTFVPYLEGVRGAFILVIVVGHAWSQLTVLRPGLLNVVPFYDHLPAVFHGLIAGFIVVSGYVLGLPVARNGNRFRRGLLHFAKRRAQRILPAYYAALAFAIVVALITGPTDTFGNPLSPRGFLVSILAHVLIVQDFSGRLIDSLDGPMWSVAVEWDIYFFFALLFVPMVRRFGFLTTTVAAFSIGLLPTLVGALRHQGNWYPLGFASFWYLGLFMIGYAAASLSIDVRPSVVRQFDRLPWGTIAVVLTAASVAGDAMLQPWTHRAALWPEDILLGVAFAAQLTADARARKFGGRTWFERVFSPTPLIFLGACSYSLYVVHEPMLTLVLALVRPGWTDPQVIACGALAVVSALVLSYVVYRTIERPFLTSYRRHGDDRSLHSTKVVEIQDAG